MGWIALNEKNDGDIGPSLPPYVRKKAFRGERTDETAKNQTCPPRSASLSLGSLLIVDQLPPIDYVHMKFACRRVG